MVYLLSTHFSRSEMICKCGCGLCLMNGAFLLMLDDLREAMGKPIYITSAYRCKSHNKKIGGAIDSQHLKGRAADIVCVSTIDRYRLIDEALKIGFKGIGVYRQFIHVDNREEDSKKIWVG